MFNEGDVERVLERLQIEGIRHGDNITASCPMHMFMKGVEDGNPSWGIHVRTGDITVSHVGTKATYYH